MYICKALLPKCLNVCLKLLNLYSHCFYRYCDPLVFIINNKPTQNIHTSKFCFMIFFWKKICVCVQGFFDLQKANRPHCSPEQHCDNLTYKSSSDPISLQYQEKLFFSLVNIYDKFHFWPLPNPCKSGYEKLIMSSWSIASLI